MFVVFLAVLQILAGNCRKVKAVKFIQINHDSITEAKEVTRLVPRIWKTKRRDDEDSVQGTTISKEPVIAKS